MRWAKSLMTVIGVGSASLPAFGQSEDLTPVGHRTRPLVAPLHGSGAPCCPPSIMPTPSSPSTLPPSTDPMNPMNPMVPNPAPNPIEQAMQNPFAQAAEAGGLAAAGFNESFDGDNSGVFYSRNTVTSFTEVTRVVGVQQVQVGTTTVTSFDPQGRPVVTRVPVFEDRPVTVTERVPKRSIARLPFAGRYNGVQIVDNDNPRPVDRAYFGYNFYSDVGGSINPAGGTDMQRQMMGFEKTFLSGDASFGMRLPFIQQFDGDGLGTQNVGDLNLLFKYAFLNDRTTGNVASVGFVLTTPTGSGDAILSNGEPLPHSWLFQPWAGFVRVMGRGYVQGISNLIVPSIGRDLTLWGNSLGAGYWLYQNPGDRMLQGIIPVVEVHVRTPLNNRDINGAIYMMDQVNMTTGVHFRMAKATISGAVCIPLVGPRPWDVEAMGYINYRF